MSGRPSGERSRPLFEGVVDDYAAARPGYPDALFDALPPLSGRRVLELGAGTGKQVPGLRARGADLVSTDLGPRMLGRLHRDHPDLPCVVARAEALPFADASFDAVAGAQMWHWVDVPAAAAEVARVLRPGGWLAVWWNDVDARAPWWDGQQERLEAAGTGYRRTYRDREYGEELAATGRFASVSHWQGAWERQLAWPLYERWLRSKSYVDALPDREDFLAQERQAHPSGVVVEPFLVNLWVARV